MGCGERKGERLTVAVEDVEGVDDHGCLGTWC